MAPTTCSSMTLAAAVAAGGALATAPAFIGSLQPRSTYASSKALDVSTVTTGDGFLSSRSSAESSKREGLAVLSLAGAGVAAAAAMGSKARSRCSAVVPLAKTQTGKMALNAFDPSTEVGVTKPLGYWDPLGFSKDGDEETFKKFRASEIKHGRVAMMATLGGVVEHFYRFPGFPEEGGGIALTDTTAGLYGWAAIFLVAAYFEVVAWVESPDKEPGNFGDPFGVDKYDEAMRTKELNNGRLAMFAAIGQVSAELFTGLDPMQQFGMGAFRRGSPLPAAGKAATFTGKSSASSSRSSIVSRGAFDPSTQVGVARPLGFFDPLGYTKDIEESEFRKYRAAEIKHGRVAMMASLGLVAQHYVSFPGLEKMPKGITAEFTQPGCFAFLALFAFAGVLELGAWSENPDKEPGNFGDPAGWGNYSDEMRTKELNNGRFAMFCIIGQLSAELYTGEDVIGQVLG